MGHKVADAPHQAQNDLRLETLGPASVAVPDGMVFEYFEEIRKIIELAREDLLFFDPYLDAQFVARYLPHVAAGVTMRLLARVKLATLPSAVDAFALQTGATVEIRSAPNFHHRYVFVDKASCYLSPPGSPSMRSLTPLLASCPPDFAWPTVSSTSLPRSGRRPGESPVPFQARRPR
jgi:hypothetical protein